LHFFDKQIEEENDKIERKTNLTNKMGGVGLNQRHYIFQEREGRSDEGRKTLSRKNGGSRRNRSIIDNTTEIGI
jgi:hypothetical protein